MIQIKNVTITHKKDLRVLLEGVSFTLGDQDRAVLIGEEGNGKSTLLAWIHDPHLIEDYAIAEGERILNGGTTGYLPQELPDTVKSLTAYEYFSASPAFLDASAGELSDMARSLGFEESFYYEDRTLRMLSGGVRIRVELARLLLEKPSVLLLDEPSNDLDLASLDCLEDVIRSFPGPVLFISHDEVLIRDCANMIIHIEQIRKKTKSRVSVVHADYDTYLQQRGLAIEKQTQEAKADQRAKKERDERYRRIREKVARAQNTISRQDPYHAALLKKKMHTVKSLGERFAKQDEDMTQMPDTEDAIYFSLNGRAMPASKIVFSIDLTELHAGNDPKAPVLARNIHLEMRGPEKTVLIGANGCGKSTLLRAIRKELEGRTDLSVQYMPQNYEDLLPMDKTPVDYLCKDGSREEQSRIRTFLGALKYTADEMDHEIRELSGGQKAKIFLLKMSLSDADLLLLDEPTRNFSPLSGPVIRQMLSAFPGAILAISHDRLFLTEVADRILMLTEDGLVPIEGDEISTF